MITKKSTLNRLSFKVYIEPLWSFSALLFPKKFFYRYDSCNLIYNYLILHQIFQIQETAFIISLSTLRCHQIISYATWCKISNLALCIEVTITSRLFITCVFNGKKISLTIWKMISNMLTIKKIPSGGINWWTD